MRAGGHGCASGRGEGWSQGGQRKGQRGEPEGGCPVNPHVTSAAHGPLMGGPREGRVRRAAGAGSDVVSEANAGPHGGSHVRRGIVDLAGQANGESSGSGCGNAHVQSRQGPHQAGKGASDAPTWSDQQAGSETGVWEHSQGTAGAVQIDIEVLLKLASRAGVQLKDMVAMTRAPLTSGLSSAGTLPIAGPDQRVAVSQLPPTTVMCAH